MTRAELTSKLTTFDVTNLVIGGIIGADIYVVSSIGAGAMGPLSLVVWALAGMMTIIIALSFARCASLVRDVGGPFAYAKEAYGSFAGFVVGWSLWIAEWVSLAVFPIAFVRYLLFFIPDLSILIQILIKVGFVVVLATTNIVGSKAAGRTNDVLTLVKLVPLILFSIGGMAFFVFSPVTMIANYTPFAPFGVGDFGSALIVIFWAFAGFEVSTIPSDSIEDPERTIPKALIIGILIVTVFYLTTNIVLFGIVPSSQLAIETAPLASAATVLFSIIPGLGIIGGLILGIGALASVSGSDESGMIGSSSLAFALAAEGLFPSIFARIHRKYNTPYISIILQAATALIASILGDLNFLISVSVLFLSIAYASTCISVPRLDKKLGESQSRLHRLVIPFAGLVFCIYLIMQCTIDQLLVGTLIIGIGIPVYVIYSPKSIREHEREVILSREHVLEQIYDREHRYLANLLRHVKRLYRRARGREQTWREPMADQAV
jgi:APA family basic amino acid/polyamine antiporter